LARFIEQTLRALQKFRENQLDATAEALARIEAATGKRRGPSSTASCAIRT
jgi:hypothetical protein